MYVAAGSLVTGQYQKVALDSLTTSTVTRGRFDEALSVRGTVSAATVVYLDAIAGGVVEERPAEQGTYDRAELLRLTDLAAAGIAEITRVQREALASLRRGP